MKTVQKLTIQSTVKVRSAQRADFIKDDAPAYGRIYFICAKDDDLLRGPYSLDQEFVKSGSLKQALHDEVIYVMDALQQQPWMEQLREHWKD